MPELRPHENQSATSMTCNKCGAAVMPVDVPEPEETGTFVEEWECANGHKGYVSGREEEPPAKWNKAGAIHE